MVERGDCAYAQGGVRVAHLPEPTGVLLSLISQKKDGNSRPFFVGGAKGSRTPDLLNAIQTRYQLRYNPVHVFIIQKIGRFRQRFLCAFRKILFANTQTI